MSQLNSLNPSAIPAQDEALRHEVNQSLRNAFERASQTGDSPVLLTSAGVRPYVRVEIDL